MIWWQLLCSSVTFRRVASVSSLSSVTARTPIGNLQLHVQLQRVHDLQSSRNKSESLLLLCNSSSIQSSSFRLEAIHISASLAMLKCTCGCLLAAFRARARELLCRCSMLKEHARCMHVQPMQYSALQPPPGSAVASFKKSSLPTPYQ